MPRMRLSISGGTDQRRPRPSPGFDITGENEARSLAKLIAVIGRDRVHEITICKTRVPTGK